MGVEALNFGYSEDILTPKSSIQSLKQQFDLHHTFKEWMESIHRSNPKHQSRPPDGGSIFKTPILLKLNKVEDEINIGIAGNASNKIDIHKSIDDSN